MTRKFATTTGLCIAAGVASLAAVAYVMMSPPTMAATHETMATTMSAPHEAMSKAQSPMAASMAAPHGAMAAPMEDRTKPWPHP